MFRWATSNPLIDQWGNAMGPLWWRTLFLHQTVYCFFAQCLETAVYLINCCLEEINLLSLLPHTLANWRGLLLLGRGWVDCFLLFPKESFTFGMLSNYSLWFNVITNLLPHLSSGSLCLTRALCVGFAPLVISRVLLPSLFPPLPAFSVLANKHQSPAWWAKLRPTCDSVHKQHWNFRLRNSFWQCGAFKNKNDCCQHQKMSWLVMGICGGPPPCAKQFTWIIS